MNEKGFKNWVRLTVTVMLVMFTICSMICCRKPTPVYINQSDQWYYDPNGCLCIPQHDIENIMRQLIECEEQ